MVEDLSLHHKLLTKHFNLPRTKAEAARYRLTDEQVAFFREYGYLHNVRLMSDEQVDALREELAELVNPTPEQKALFYEYHSNESADPNTVLFHALGAWRVKPLFHDILWNPALVIPASQLLGGAVRFWHDQLFCKPARHGGVVAWHQDYSYWTRTQPMSHLTCWMGMDDATKENGCLVYVPKSHNWPLLPKTGLAGDMHAIQTVLDDEQKAGFQEVYIELKKGCCSFHHPLLVHGSYANRSERSRRAVVLNYVRDGVRSVSDQPLLDGVPPVKAGDALGGQFFPLVYDEAALAP